VPVLAQEDKAQSHRILQMFTHSLHISSCLVHTYMMVLPTAH